MTSLFPITDADKLACIEREIRMREKVYPRWIEKGKLTFEKAAHEILVMQKIAEDYREKTK